MESAGTALSPFLMIPSPSRARGSRAVCLAAALALPLFAGACRRSPVAVSTKSSTPPGASPAAATPPPALPDFAVDAVSTREGNAVWYDVPGQSLPVRRAWSGEMTAASDTLPMNSYVRVRRIDKGDNGKNVVVRITDSGVQRRGTLIDLNREAAETLGMVAKGAVRVRVETLALKNADADKPVAQKDSTPSAAKITSTPAATREQEKNNAAGKAPGS